MPIPRSAIGLVTTDVEIQVDRYQLELFAQATGNMAGPYTDVDAARAAGHPDVLVPPTFHFGLELMRPEPFAWLVEYGVDPGHILHGAQGFTFHRAAYAGDVLRYRAVVTDVQQKRGGLLELVDREAEVTRSGQPVVSLRQTLIVRRPSAN